MVKLSIIIAVLNSHPVVIRQIRSWKKMRLPKSVEFILVDDGSDPPLAFENSGLRNLRIFYTNDKRPWTQGLARNLGASKAFGEYFLFTDIDHILTREAIMDALSFEGDKMSFPRFFGYLDKRGNIVSDVESLLRFGLDPRRLRGKRKLFAGYHGNTYSISRRIFEMIGGYNPAYCTQGFHMGGATMSEERKFNLTWNKFVNRGYATEEAVGSRIYHYPVSKFRADGDNNPFGLFHKLSLEQVPQPLKE